MNRASAGNGVSGFTLMELLVSITIVLAIVSVTAGAFNLVYTSVEKGEDRLDEQQRLSVAVDLISRHLDALCIKEQCMLEGDDKSIRFHSYIPFKDTETHEIMEIEYRTEQNPASPGTSVLQIRLQPGFPLGKKDENDTFHDLLTGIDNFLIQYLVKGSTKKNSYAKEWNNKRVFPLAVKISFRYYGEPVEIFSRTINTRENR